MPAINISGPTYNAPSQPTNNQRCLNLMPIMPGPQGRGQGTLVPRSGLFSLVNTGKQSIRALHAIDNVVYCVADNKFFKITIDTVQRTAVAVEKGTINNYSGRVEINSNTTQVFVVNGTSTGYIYTIAADTFVAITDGDFVGGITATFMDGYFIYTPTDSQQIYSSALNDGLSWDATDVATAEYKNDTTVKLITKKRELWVLGQHSAEVWYDAANVSGSPFSPRVGSEIGIGCLSGASVVALNNTLFWLDDRGFVVTASDSTSLTNNTTGHDASIISTDAVNAAFATYSDTANAIGVGYQERGHLIYQITFPRDKKTWAFDLQTEQWHERSFYDTGLAEHVSHLAHHCVQARDLNIVGGPASGIVYIMHPDYHDDAGEGIRGLRITAPLNQEFKFIGVDKLEIRCNSGEATQSGAGSNPQVLLRYSHDGGRTWSHEISRELGDVGEYGKRIIWNRLGVGAEWVFEFTIVDPINFSIVDASVDLQEIEDY